MKHCDPDDWAREHCDPKYILTLLKSIITVSMDIMKIVNGLATEASGYTPW